MRDTAATHVPFNVGTENQTRSSNITSNKEHGVPDAYHSNRVFGTVTVYGILSLAHAGIS